MKKYIYLFLALFIVSCSQQVDGYSWNNLQTINQGGLEIQVARIAIYNKSSIPKDEQKNLDSSRGFYEKPTICDLYFKITNNTDKVMSVYTDQGLLMANDEQVQLLSYSFMESGTLGGEIFPGATVNGFIKFGLKKVTPQNISKMLIKINSPHDSIFRSYGGDYVFNLDLREHKWVEKPDELK